MGIYRGKEVDAMRDFKIFLKILLVSLFAYSMPMGAFSQGIIVRVDGQPLMLDQPATMVRGRVMVPLRGIFENLGAQVNYDPNTRTIQAFRGTQQVTLTLNSQAAFINSQPYTLDAPPTSLGGRTLVPLRFISEALGSEVHWQAYDHSVNILSRTGGASLPVPATSTYPTGNLIQSLSISPRNVAAGQSINVTVKGAAGGTATARIGSQQPMLLTETSSGTYTGTLQTAASLPQGTYSDVIVNLQLPHGRLQTMTDTGAIQIGSNTQQGGLALSVNSPLENSTVPQVFDIQGSTQPNAMVALRLLAQQNNFLGSILGARQGILNTQTTSDANGNFVFHVDSGNLSSGAQITALLQSRDSSGNSSGERQFVFVRQ